jgi:6-phosphogluconolactonase
MPRTRLIAFVGSYGTADGGGGGIDVFEVSSDGTRLTPISRVDNPAQAGYLVYAPTLQTLYAVDERKTDGRGPVGPAAAVHAFAVDQHDGLLTWRNSQPSPGPNPTFLTVHESTSLLISANHGGFEHVEHVVRTADGGWTVDYLYDDSTVIAYQLRPDGAIDRIRDLRVLSGHGRDPNTSPQAGGHAQSSAHAHCAVIDPSGRYLLVGDKGTDEILVFSLDIDLEPVATYRCPPQTAPRHIAFDASSRAFVTLELSSELASFAFDPVNGQLQLLHRASTVAPDHDELNEPAEVRVHPNGSLVYVNNRGEDSLAWFRIGAGGELDRLGHVSLAPSVHPGLAARSFTFDPTGSFILVADRPANLVRSYAVDSADGRLRPLTEVPVPDPAFIAFAELPAA